MTSDDQHFLDLLSIVPQEVKRYSKDLVSAVDRGFDNVAFSVKEHLGLDAWWPQSSRPPFLRTGGVSPRWPSKSRSRSSLISGVNNWLSRHQVLTFAIVVFVGAGATCFLYWRGRSYRRRGRAKRRLNGARKEVVVVFGSFKEPIARAVILDLERRGYVVYVVIDSQDDEETVRAEGRTDILPMFLNFTSPPGMKQAVQQLSRILRPRLHSATSSVIDDMTLSGLIIVPDTSYPSGPSNTIPPEIWSDVLNARILAPVETVQALLPLVADFNSKIIFMTPCASTSLSMPLHTVENTVVAALDGYAKTIRNEVRHMGVGVHQIKLGSFDITKYLPSNMDQLRPLSVHSSSQVKGLEAQYIREMKASVRGSLLRERSKGSNLKELNWAVFDLLAGRRNGNVIRVGQGSFSYFMIGALIPYGLVGWMMGFGLHDCSDQANDSRPTNDSASWEKV